ncbi:MAG TPA: CPBP family intramembrane glutamic endopeptidase [Candidatus Eisenbacteria bacterium]|nr:CPBP family intramembrane glutamic endopeptidase [Candidatus Eisenbacteria bacterium]
MIAVGIRQLAPAHQAALLSLGLVAVVGARWAATIGGAAGGLAVGLLFGAALLALAALAGRPPIERNLPAAAAIGLAGGLALVGIALVARLPVVSSPMPSGSFAGPAAIFVPWVAITVLVATAEELVLRGALFRAFEASAGLTAAVLLTTLAFALMHVPLYGWHVVPLDLGVGLWLAGLRLLSGGIVAPAVAHMIADLVTWWL